MQPVGLRCFSGNLSYIVIKAFTSVGEGNDIMKTCIFSTFIVLFYIVVEASKVETIGQARQELAQLINMENNALISTEIS